MSKGPTDAMQFGHGTQSDDVTNRSKALYVVGHCMLSHWFTSSLHTITLYGHTGPVGDAPRPPFLSPSLSLTLAARSRGSPRAGTVLLSGKLTIRRSTLSARPRPGCSKEPIRSAIARKNPDFQSNTKSRRRRLQLLPCGSFDVQ